MPPLIRSRSTLVLVCVALLALAGCHKAKPATSETPPPEATPGIQGAGDFSVIGRVQRAFLSEGPDLAPGEIVPSAPPAVQGTVTPPDKGVMRIKITQADSALQSACNAAVGDEIKIYWSPQSLFDPALLQGDPEATLEGSLVGVTGTIFKLPAAGTGLDFSSPSPPASPVATSGVDQSCILVAQQITTSHGALPTPFPHRRVVTTPTPTPTHAPSPTPTHTPHPTATATHTPHPTATATATVAPSPTAT